MSAPDPPLSRAKIAQLIGDRFDAGPATAVELLIAARRKGAHPAILDMLSRLPNRPYRDLHHVWSELSQLPDPYDPGQKSQE
jgi:hypothetical protein